MCWAETKGGVKGGVFLRERLYWEEVWAARGVAQAHQVAQVNTTLQSSLLGTELKVFSVVRDPEGLSKVGMLCLNVLLPSSQMCALQPGWLLLVQRLPGFAARVRLGARALL